MRVLVLGGTAFLSRAVAARAVLRGHEVVCAARGVSGSVAEGARLVVIDRDQPDALQGLADQAFDAVVDVATMSYPWVRDALGALGTRAGHWTFVSSINVYASAIARGQNEDAPLHAPLRSGADAMERIQHPHLYGGIKVACEQAVREVMGDRALIVRSGLIVGPGDVSDRFGYWPARVSRGGRVLVPDVPDQPTQYTDVRDVAAWIVRAAEQKTAGTYNAVGPSCSFGDLVSGIVAAAGAADIEFVPVPADWLVTAGVQEWRGKRSLPLWVPPEDDGFMAHDHSRAAAAGLRHRPLDEVVTDVLAYERRRGLDRGREAGLMPDEEAELIGLWEGA